jgi:predicted amidohydrolase
LSLTGYDVGNAGPMLALPLDDPLMAQIATFARGITVVVGFIELGFAAQLHNSVVALRDGKVLFLHRKLNLPNYGKLEEGKHFASGRYLDSVDLKKPWHAGILTCADAWHPALVHLLALRGATLMMVPTNSARDSVAHSVYGNSEGWHMSLQFYAYMYGLPTIFANRVGHENGFEFWGGSRIFDAHGEVVAEGGGEEQLVIAELRYQEVVQARASLPTVRDSNLDLIHREIGALRDTIGHPALVKPFN